MRPRSLVRPPRDRIREQALFDQAYSEDRKTDREVFTGKPIGGRFAELWHDLAVVQDRAGDQMGKEGHEQDVVEQTSLLRDALFGIDQITDLCECEK